MQDVDVAAPVDDRMVALERRIMDLIGQALARGRLISNGPAWERGGLRGIRPGVWIRNGVGCLVGILADQMKPDLAPEDLPHELVATGLGISHTAVCLLECGFEDWGNSSAYSELGQRIRVGLGLPSFSDLVNAEDEREST